MLTLVIIMKAAILCSLSETYVELISLTEIEEAFKLFDKNGDGTISASELGNVFRNLGQQHTADEIKSFLKSVDKDGRSSNRS